MLLCLLLIVVSDRIYGEGVDVVTISNIEPRLDTDGQIMDIHDGNTLLINGVYYYYGAQYGDCKEPTGSNGCADVGVGNCGFRVDHNVSLYTSTNLGSWKKEPVVFQFHTHPIPGIMFCPKVIYNVPTKLYVLWYNWLPASVSDFSESYIGVAVSPSPLGPFKVTNYNITLAYEGPGDFALFHDDNAGGEGYIIYTSHIRGYQPNHVMSIEKLSPDFQSSLGKNNNSGFFGNTFVEAPTMFKYNGFYYAVFGACCCYCGSGSPVYYYRSANPLGPYSNAIQLTDGTIKAQQTNILPFTSSKGEGFMWQGDRWQSSPDGLKGHDYTYFGSISFDKSGNPEVLTWENSFTLEMPNK